MRPLVDPSDLSAEQRLNELAGIFASGLMRLRKRQLLVGEPAEMPRKTSAESTAERLELSAETVLSVHTS